jgi:hypothetical protein
VKGADGYYIPSIEEFKAGFEYEIQDDNGIWLWSNVPQDIELLSKCIKDKRCRAKKQQIDKPTHNQRGSNPANAKKED